MIKKFLLSLSLLIAGNSYSANNSQLLNLTNNQKYHLIAGGLIAAGLFNHFHDAKNRSYDSLSEVLLNPIFFGVMMEVSKVFSAMNLSK